MEAEHKHKNDGHSEVRDDENPMLSQVQDGAHFVNEPNPDFVFLVIVDQARLLQVAVTVEIDYISDDVEGVVQPQKIDQQPGQPASFLAKMFVDNHDRGYYQE